MHRSRGLGFFRLRQLFPNQAAARGLDFVMLSVLLLYAWSVVSHVPVWRNNVTLWEARGRDYALSAFDIRDRFSLSSTYELPFGQGKHFLNGLKGAAEKVISGWQLNAIAGLQGGLPFTTGVGFNRARDGNSAAVDRPNMAPGRTLGGIYLRGPDRWYDPTAFALPLAGTYGNVGRNVLIGPGLRSFDLSLFKATRLNERWNLQFRAEFFNLFNHTGFGIPANIVLTTTGAPAPSAGRITTTTIDARQIQFGLKLAF